jgi:hypothetical protein
MSSRINKLNFGPQIPQETTADLSPRPWLARPHNLGEFSLERFFAFIALKLTSGFNEPLVLSFVFRFRRSLLLFACLSHTASQILAV